MTDLSWHQAKILAKRGYAVRRSGWLKQWLIYRLRLWLISDLASGKEVRRVVRNTDFTDSEFLAKDWTDQPIDDLPLPPCSRAPLATEAPPLTSRGVFSLTDFCGGAGTGGGVLIEHPDDPTDIGLEMLLLESTSATGASILTPDGSGCWNTPPGNAYAWILAKTSLEFAGGIFYTVLNLDGTDLSGLDYEGAAGLANSIPMSSDSEAAIFYTNYPEVIEGERGAPWYPHQFGSNTSPLTYTTGETYTALVEYRKSIDGAERRWRVTGSIVHPADCP